MIAVWQLALLLLTTAAEFDGGFRGGPVGRVSGTLVFWVLLCPGIQLVLMTEAYAEQYIRGFESFAAAAPAVYGSTVGVAAVVVTYAVWVHLLPALVRQLCRLNELIDAWLWRRLDGPRGSAG